MFGNQFLRLQHFPIPHSSRKELVWKELPEALQICSANELTLFKRDFGYTAISVFRKL